MFLFIKGLLGAEINQKVEFNSYLIIHHKIDIVNQS